MADLKSGEGQFLSAIAAAQVDEKLPRVTWVLYLLLALVIAFVAWAAWAEVDEIARAEGRIVPDGRDQVIASLEAGLLGEMMVREGDQVKKGQPIVRLDPTRVEASQNESELRRKAITATVARLRAEATGGALVFPPELKDSKGLRAAETEAFESRRRLMDDSLAGANRSIALVQRELEVAQRMSAQGLMSNVEVMRLTRQVSDMQGSRTERINRFRQEVSAELVRLQNELAMLDEQLVVRNDQMERTTLTSPVDGIVKRVHMNTVGGVVGGGTPIMEISPMGGRLLVEARVRPRDIGFVSVGQGAEVKLSGYDYNVWGGLHGSVHFISPDALGDADKGADASYYRTIIVSERNELRPRRGQPLPLIPGMAATVEIKTGQRSVLSYLLRPMMKSREALRER